MKWWLLVVAVILFLLFLLCRTRVGIWVAFGGEKAMRLDACLGPLRLHILPAKPKKKPKKEKTEPAGPSKPGKKFSITLEDVKDAAATMFPPLKRALSRTRRGLRIFPLCLSVTLGGQEDPAEAAKLYGWLQAAVWTGMPVLEKLVNIPDPRIHTGVDFEASQTAAEGEVGASFRIGTLLAMGFGIAIPALRWFFRWQKRCKTRPPKAEKQKKPDAADRKPAPQPSEAAETGTH